MEESFSVLRALPHGRQTARDRVREHGESETTNDVAAIMATISHWDQHFAVLTEAEDGTLSLRLEVDRVVTQFYAFASYRLILERPGRRAERELALMLPVGRDGRFVGEFSYALEVGSERW